VNRLLAERRKNVKIISNLRALAGPFRPPILAALLASLVLQGCVAALTLAGVAGSAGVEHTISGISHRTFNHAVPRVRASTLITLKRMGMKVTEDKEIEGGWSIKALAENRKIEIELEHLTNRTTRMEAIANVGDFFFKDSATSTAIIKQTAVNFKHTSASLDKPRKSSRKSSKFPSKTVKIIQAKLAGLGYNPGPADGILGRKTTDAIKAFQRDEGLAVNGKATAKLASQLNRR